MIWPEYNLSFIYYLVEETVLLDVPVTQLNPLPRRMTHAFLMLFSGFGL